MQAYKEGNSPPPVPVLHELRPLVWKLSLDPTSTRESNAHPKPQHQHTNINTNTHNPHPNTKTHFIQARHDKKASITTTTPRTHLALRLRGHPVVNLPDLLAVAPLVGPILVPVGRRPAQQRAGVVQRLEPRVGRLLLGRGRGRRRERRELWSRVVYMRVCGLGEREFWRPAN